MYKFGFANIVGFLGILLILVGYYLLLVPVDADLYEVILRTRFAIMMNLFGCIMALYYLYKR